MRIHVAWLALALTACLVDSGQSQEESGRILGRVVTQDGTPAATVRVEAQSASLLGPRRETTDARGTTGPSGCLWAAIASGSH